ncbi:MAG: type IV conjugative transfer system protein TraL [Gammaproteobacteria bacterium]|nr:type IV conjugative transfer system protein TraL [Gammaproteobacteria bacterium]NNL50783.1 hypothetical protein [Woeseiaceae bacterium]
MKYSSANKGFPAGNPIANIFVIVVGALAIGVSVVLGFVAFIVLGSIVVVLASVLGLRLWWFGRKLKAGGQNRTGDRPAASGGIIEGEYHVVEDERNTTPDR